MPLPSRQTGTRQRCRAQPCTQAQHPARALVSVFLHVRPFTVARAVGLQPGWPCRGQSADGPACRCRRRAKHCPDSGTVRDPHSLAGWAAAGTAPHRPGGCAAGSDQCRGARRDSGSPRRLDPTARPVLGHADDRWSPSRPGTAAHPGNAQSVLRRIEYIEHAPIRRKVGRWKFCERHMNRCFAKSSVWQQGHPRRSTVQGQLLRSTEGRRWAWLTDPLPLPLTPGAERRFTFRQLNRGPLPLQVSKVAPIIDALFPRHRPRTRRRRVFHTLLNFPINDRRQDRISGSLTLPVEFVQALKLCTALRHCRHPPCRNQQGSQSSENRLVHRSTPKITNRLHRREPVASRSGNTRTT